MAKTVRLADIAKVVGVSNVTVSKALADKSGVSEEVRQRIKEVASEMGYQSSSAQKREMGTGNIGVLIPQEFLDRTNSFYWDMYQQVVTKAAVWGYYCILEILKKEDEQNQNLPKMIQDEKIDGMILIGQTRPQYLKKIWESKRVPMMFLDFYDSTKEYDTVISDGFYGMYLMTDYLIRKGHRDIAFVGTPMSTSSITDRYFGYRKAIMEHGIEFQEEWLVPDRGLEPGAGVPDMLSLPKQMPTAFACNSDYTAGVLVKTLEAMGYAVPEDVSIVGFDNCEWDNMLNVSITSYDVKKDKMAEIAVKNLVKKINQEDYVQGLQIITGEIIEKDSVKNKE